VSATVPREKATERELDAPADEALDEAGAARVLIVDDEESIRLALSRYLRTRGYAPDAAASGEAALDSLARRHYALLICDVRMPNMSGLELVPRARAAAPDLAIIMLSAVNDAVTAAAAMSAGAIAYLLKPVDLRDLSETVERALHQRATRDDGGRGAFADQRHGGARSVSARSLAARSRARRVDCRCAGIG
jgi:DNA-binding NtrC family response regulator